jgi:hypothetical protein
MKFTTVLAIFATAALAAPAPSSSKGEEVDENLRDTSEDVPFGDTLTAAEEPKQEILEKASSMKAAQSAATPSATPTPTPTAHTPNSDLVDQILRVGEGLPLGNILGEVADNRINVLKQAAETPQPVATPTPTLAVQ